MRILFLSSSFPNSLNPARGTFNLSLMRAVSAAHDVRVVSPVSWVDELAARRKGQSHSRAIAFGLRLQAVYPRFYYPPRILRSQYGRFLWWSIRGTILQQLKDFRPEAIVSYWAHPDGEAAVRAGQRAGVPVVAMVGGSDVLLLGRSGSRRRAIHNVLTQSDAIVPVSRNIEQTLLADGFPASKIEVIPRGVDRQVFHPGDRAVARRKLGMAIDRPLLVAVGRLVPVKGFDVLVEACRLARERVPNLSCVILGGGPLEQTLASRIRAAGLDDTVQLLGPRPQHELAEWYRAADSVVLTSHSEGIPNVLLESLACGTPFIATRVGSVPDIADERHHPLVPPGNPHAFAEAIGNRFAAPVTAGLRFRFVPPSWEESAGQLLELIASLRAERTGNAFAVAKDQ